MNHPGESYPIGLPVDNLLLSGNGNGRKPVRSLAIVGSHPATRELAPWDDLNVDIMLFNESAQKPEVYKRWDMLLQIHAPEVYTSLNNWVNKDHWQWLQTDHGQGKRIWMQDRDERVPNSVRYPLQEILAMTPYEYLRSSPAMALALGIYLGYKRILLYGSELTSNTEYSYQATNYAFWIGFAHGRGIDLQLNCWQAEFHQRIYGFEGELQLPQSHFTERFEAYKSAWAEQDNAMKKIQARMSQAMLDNDYDKAGSLSIALENVAVTAGEAFGMMSEAGRYSAKPDLISRQEFERTAAYAQEAANDLRDKKAWAGGKCEYAWNVWKVRGTNDSLNQFRLFVQEKIQHSLDLGTKMGVYRENINYMLEYDAQLQAAGGVRALGKPEEYMRV